MFLVPSVIFFMGQRTREAGHEIVAALGGFQQHRAAVRTRVRLIEARDEGPGEQVGKEKSVLSAPS